MENQHRKITGYRELTEDEIKLMNYCKEVGAVCETLINSLNELEGVDPRAVSIAKTKLQEGIMWAVRSVAKPESF